MELFLLMVWVGSIVACLSLAPKKGLSTGLWFVLSLLFSFLALIALVLWPRNQAQLDKQALAWGHARKCPACAELVKPEAQRCRYCGQDLEPIAAAAPPTSVQSGKLDWPDSR